MNSSACLSVEVLGGYASGTLCEADAQATDTHLKACAVCLARLDELARVFDPLVAALRRPASPRKDQTHLQRAVAAVLSGKNGFQRDSTLPAPPLQGGEMVGGYRIVGELGRGGMGRVYRAVHPRLEQEVALKVMRPGMHSAPILARFEAERQTLALMDHPHIARVSDGGKTEDDRPFFVMELVRGVPITRYCDEHQLDLHRRLDLFTLVCQAVQHAHQKGIIHRDLKPSNVLVAEYDGKATPKVIDFGVARAIERRTGAETEVGMLVGTPDYMSPEQADLSSQDIDTRSDVYSLGALLYELVTGVPPLARSPDTPILERLRVIREVEPAKPSERALSDPRLNEVDWIVLKALDKDRARRYQTAAGLADDVRRFLNHEPVEAGPPSRTYRFKKFVRRNRIAVGFALLLLAATVVSSALAWWANNERVRAESAEGKERNARTIAQSRLGQIEKVNAILSTVFSDINPRDGSAQGDDSLRLLLGKRLDAAAGQIDESAIGDPATVAGLQERIGMAQLSLGSTNKALALLTTASGSRDRLHGPDHEETLEARNMLATALYAAGRTREMIEILEDVIRRHQSQPRPTADLLARAMSNLSTGYLAAGRNREALKLAEDTFQTRLAQLGAADESTISSRNSLALAYRAAGDRATAIRLTEENLALQMASSGPEHPDTVATRQNLGILYAFTGRAAEGVVLLEEVLAFRVRTLSSDHPATLTTRDNLGECYRALKRTKEALVMHEETLRLCKRILGPLDKATLRSQDHVAEVYVELKRYPEAIALHEETWKLRTSTLSADHPDTLVSSDHLAIAYRRSGRVGDAIRQQEDTLARRKAVLGEDHPDSQRSAGNLANAYVSDKKHEEAARVYGELIASRRRTKSPLLADTCSAFGGTLLTLQKGAEAEPVFRECLALREKQQPNAWSTIDTRANLAESLMVQRKLAAAEPLFIEAYNAMMQSKDPARQPSRISQVAGRLVQLYEALGNPEEAAQWRAKK